MYRPFACIMTILLMTTSCKKDEGDPTGFLLPNQFFIKGSAKGKVGDLEIDCLCDLIVEIKDVRRTQNVTIYQGTHGGHFERKVLNPDGSGSSLLPDVFGEMIIYQYDDKDLLFSIPINKGSGVAFYEQTSSMEGCIEGESIRGDWLCAPFETRDDTIGMVSGTWQLEKF